MKQRDAGGKPVYPDARPNAFEIGLEFQDFVCQVLAREHIVLQNVASKRYQLHLGENLQGFEVKYDERCTETGRLSIEVAEKSRDDPALPWTPSGILRDDNTWLYIQGNYEVLFVFAKNWLVRYYEERRPETTRKFGTIETFYLPMDVAEWAAARVIRPPTGDVAHLAARRPLLGMRKASPAGVSLGELLEAESE